MGWSEVPVEAGMEEGQMKDKAYKGWHFANEDMRLGYNDGRKIVVGETLSVNSEDGRRPDLCFFGLHWSTRIIDALKYAQGNKICRIEGWGDVDVGDNKMCGTHRKVLWVVDANRLLHEFACRCAEDALSVAGVTDERCFAAIKAKRMWLVGKISSVQLAAAWAAAGDAARAAARAAAGAAAWAAARAAAGAAAWAAAGDAARAAARAAQNNRLTAMVSAAHRKDMAT